MITADQTYKDLHKKYNKQTLTKIEMAQELGVALSTLSNYLASGRNLPNYIKLGEAKNARVLFPLREVADFLSQNLIKTI